MITVAVTVLLLACGNVHRIDLPSFVPATWALVRINDRPLRTPTREPEPQTFPLLTLQQPWLDGPSGSFEYDA